MNGKLEEGHRKMFKLKEYPKERWVANQYLVVIYQSPLVLIISANFSLCHILLASYKHVDNFEVTNIQEE